MGTADGIIVISASCDVTVDRTFTVVNIQLNRFPVELTGSGLDVTADPANDFEHRSHFRSPKPPLVLRQSDRADKHGRALCPSPLPMQLHSTFSTGGVSSGNWTRD